MDKHYDFNTAEKKWNEYWAKHRSFKADPGVSGKAYSIVIPPPNVTDILHLGHALNNAIQDILIRHHRNQGYNTEWLPGTDHAGIATQVIVEKMLQKEGKTKEDLGREAFLEMVWEYVNGRKDRILKQLAGIGCSCDWDRTRFTLDEGLSKTVAHVFKELYDSGYIYKGTYIINWCPRCHTALSDEEVDYNERNAKLYYIKYPVKGNNEFITVATTRPETMLGDTAVAINPNDEAKKHLLGKTLILPLVDREIPIIPDEHVDMEFGTGYVKVTPAHDPNDFLIGKRHNLEEILIMDTKANINSNGGKYKGMSREDARKQILKDLDELGLVDKIEDYKHSVGSCYRCKTIIEPYLSEQWFVKMEKLAKPALDVSLNGELGFYPQRWQGVYNHWLKNIKDWCISRQLWWGHRIPVYYCDDCNNEFASVETPEKCSKCGSNNIRQDENVLDTWFSSWLWPFSTMGWPEENEFYKTFYPTNVIVSASEILFFWMARMIMAGIHFTGKMPFKDIYIHGTVRDLKGVKMSKSLGNGIDPLLITEKFGADALRFSMVFISGQGKDPNVSENTFELGRNFANKLWNAVRYVLMNNENPDINKGSEPKNIYDRWILTRLKETEDAVNSAMQSYRFADSAQQLYEFFWHDFCDWYLEICKVSKSGMDTAVYVIYRFIRILNPIMPYITEEINSILGSSLMIQDSYGETGDYAFIEDKENIDTVKSLITALRNLITETGSDIIEILPDGKYKDIISSNLEVIGNLAKTSNLSMTKEEPAKSIPGIFEGGMVFVSAQNIADIEEKLKRYEKDREQLEKEIEKIKRNLSNDGFVSKAPEDVVNKMREKEMDFAKKLERVNLILNRLG